MDNREELKRSLAEEEERAKDSLANIEKMKKQLEELDKKEEQPTVSATGVYLKEIKGRDYFFISGTNSVDSGDVCYEKQRMLICNSFATEEQAEQEALRIEGQEFIRRCAMLWNNDHDWRKDFNKKGQINLYYSLNHGLSIANYDSFGEGNPYFDNYELANQCVKELKEKYNEEQIKTIFGVK